MLLIILVGNLETNVDTMSVNSAKDVANNLHGNTKHQISIDSIVTMATDDNTPPIAYNAPGVNFYLRLGAISKNTI